jgi:hypothetical protein
MKKTVHRECTNQEKNTDQAILKSKKSKKEEKNIAPEALDQSIRVLITVPLFCSIFPPAPSKLLEFLSHQIHQKMQRGIISHSFLILALQQPAPQQDNNSSTPHSITHSMSKMLKMKVQISLADQQCIEDER